MAMFLTLFISSPGNLLFSSSDSLCEFRAFLNRTEQQEHSCLCLDFDRVFTFSLTFKFVRLQGLTSEVVQESIHLSHMSSEHASLLWLWQYDKREISSLCAAQTSSSENQALPSRNRSNLEQSIHGDRSLHMRANLVAMYDSTAVATSIMIRQHSLMAWRSKGQNCREKFRGLTRACAAMGSSTHPQFACRLLQNIIFPMKFPSVRHKDTKITPHCWWGTGSVRILVTHANLWLQNMKASPDKFHQCSKRLQLSSQTSRMQKKLQLAGCFESRANAPTK